LVEHYSGVIFWTRSLTALGRFRHPGAMPKPSFELDPREVEDFIHPLPARQQRVYRPAVRGLCPRSFRQDRRAHGAIPRGSAAVLSEADTLAAELTAAASGR
jgi:hypothetical protein